MHCPPAFGGSEGGRAAGGAWGLAEGREALLSLGVGAAGLAVPLALGCGDVFPDGLAVDDVLFGVPGTKDMLRRARAIVEAGAEAAAHHRGAGWPGHVGGLGAPLTLQHVELDNLPGAHAAPVLSKSAPGDGRVVNKYFFLRVVPSEETVPTLPIVPLDGSAHLLGDDFLGRLSLGTRCRCGFQGPGSTCVAGD